MAVEADIVLPVILALVIGLVDFGRLTFSYLTANQAAIEAARALSLGQDLLFAQTVLNNMLSSVPELAGTGSVTFSATPCPIDAVLDGTSSAAVQVSFDFQWLTPLGLLAGDSTAVLPDSINVGASSICRS